MREMSLSILSSSSSSSSAVFSLSKTTITHYHRHRHHDHHLFAQSSLFLFLSFKLSGLRSSSSSLPSSCLYLFLFRCWETHFTLRNTPNGDFISSSLRSSSSSPIFNHSPKTLFFLLQTSLSLFNTKTADR